ncbi:hypothetical protein [Streptomyces sioyaensis]|uniref:hypothetical protein n=1 Tax=Streptomyces sioyaensis TaxID=67364 RepID=UPI0036E032F8
MLFDLDVVSDNIDRLREAIPQAEIYYAVKAAQFGSIPGKPRAGCFAGLGPVGRPSSA